MNTVSCLVTKWLHKPKKILKKLLTRLKNPILKFEIEIKETYLPFIFLQRSFRISTLLLSSQTHDRSQDHCHDCIGLTWYWSQISFKGSLTWEKFSQSQKKVPDNNPEHLFFMWIVLRVVIWYLLFWDLRQIEKLFEIKPPLMKLLVGCLSLDESNSDFWFSPFFLWIFSEVLDFHPKYKKWFLDWEIHLVFQWFCQWHTQAL